MHDFAFGDIRVTRIVELGNYSPGFVVRCLGAACLAPTLPGRAGSAAS